MKRGIALAAILLSLSLNAGERAITEDGSVVILNEDGTWVYESQPGAIDAEIPASDLVFARPENANFRFVSKNNRSAVWVDVKRWKVSKQKVNEDADHSFQLKDGDVYAMMLSEEIQIEPKALTDVAIENARSAAPDIRVIKRERRTVNGMPVIYMEMRGTTSGIDIPYCGYYWSDASGSTELLAYTGSSLREKYDQQIQDLLNGFSLQSE